MTGIRQGLKAARRSQRDDLHFAMLAAIEAYSQLTDVVSRITAPDSTAQCDTSSACAPAHVSPSRLGNQKTPILLAIRRQKRVAP
jgi:hypothetical protein